MKTLFKILLIAAALGLAWAAYTAAQGPFAFKRSLPGHMVRHFKGKGGLIQSVDDVADELSKPNVVAALRSWATAVLVAERGRKVPFPDGGPRFDNGIIKCVEAKTIAPPPELAKFKAVLVCTPVTYLNLDADGYVVSVLLSWGNLRCGLIVVPSGTAPALQNTCYERQVAPDIRVFSID